MSLNAWFHLTELARSQQAIRLEEAAQRRLVAAATSNRAMPPFDKKQNQPASTTIERIARAVSNALSRRTLFTQGTAVALAVMLHHFGAETAAAASELVSDGKQVKKRKRKRKHCPKPFRCGKRCCKAGQVCSSGVCAQAVPPPPPPEQGTCPTGADTCAAGFAIFCGDSCVCVSSIEGATRCADASDIGDCGGCTSSSQCAAFGPAGFCVKADGACGCAAGQGVCARPCASF